MRLAEAPAERVARWTERLFALYAAFETHRTARDTPTSNCGTCSRCCVGPPLYMTCTELEYACARAEAQRRQPGLGVHFEPVRADRPDQRLAFLSWTCPFHSQRLGCLAYTGRPFACRVYGPWARAPIPWDGCAFKTTTRLYRDPGDLPGWSEYVQIAHEGNLERGYIFPDQLQFERPAVELLLGVPAPIPLLANLRL